MKRTPLRKVSKKRAVALREYAKVRAEYLAEHPWCEWWLCENSFHEGNVHDGFVQRLHGPKIAVPAAIEIHHRKGRGKYLCHKSTFMSVSRAGHDWIHSNPKEAMQKGYILRR